VCVLAIYSCNLKSIGRTTHDAGTAGAHIRYISRDDARPFILAHRMPDEHRAARTWMDQQERDMRKNARVIDKLRIALPRELSEGQRADLVHGFMAELTGGSIPWFAAIHQTGKDELNPHVHIAIHDRDTETGKRVLRLSDNARDREKAGLPGPKAVEWVRERWEQACNGALEQAGLAVRVDRRTLSAQGIDRKPTIHEGPRAQHIDDHVKRPQSQARINGCGRVIDYPSIDHGKTRREFNAHIIDINLAQAARSGNPAKAIWALYEKEQGALDAKLEARLAAERRTRTAETRNTSLLYRSRMKRIAAEGRLKLRAAERGVRAKYTPLRAALRERQQGERAQLRAKQGKLYARIVAWLDFTGITKRRQEAARKALSARHKGERRSLSARHRKAGSLVKASVRERFAGEIASQQKKRAQHLTQLKERNQQAEAFADHERQRRENERERMRAITEAKIEAWRRQQEKEERSKTGGDFASAVMKAAKQEADRGDKHNPKDRGYER
jgi:hypothetical protein